MATYNHFDDEERRLKKISSVVGMSEDGYVLSSEVIWSA